jgi:hypothetical protein
VKHYPETSGGALGWLADTHCQDIGYWDRCHSYIHHCVRRGGGGEHVLFAHSPVDNVVAIKGLEHIPTMHYALRGVT